MKKPWKKYLSVMAPIALSLGFALLSLSGCPTQPVQQGYYFNASGYYLYVEDSGVNHAYSPSNLPPLVLVSGVGLTENCWDKVQPELTKMVRVISYDRGGVGNSEPGPNPRTGNVIVEELDALLSGMGINPPYVLCAHSLGGFFARLYANAYPEKIAGLLLLDTAHEDINNRFAELLSPESALSYQLQQGVVMVYSSRNPGSLGEYLNFENTAAQIRANRELPSVPLIFIGRDSAQFWFIKNKDEIDLAYQLTVELAEEQVALVPRGEYREIIGSTHMVQEDSPESVIQAVKDIYAKLGFDLTGSQSAQGE